MATPKGSSEIAVKEKVVVVMGPSGVGKTTFINYATGRGDYGINHGVRSGTTRVEWIKSTSLIDGRNFTFIDTPGIDGTEQQAMKIITSIKAYLRSAQRVLYAILYLHRISANRMSRSGLENLKLFTSSCDINATANTVLVTTMWNEIEETVWETVGGAREKELKTEFCAELIPNGCEVTRFHQTAQSALDVLRLISDKRIIVIMGPTGVGKTTFINCVAKRGNRGVGHDIESCTAKVALINAEDPIHGRQAVLVDTPGFDDTYKSDIEILTMIAEFLVRTYKTGLVLDTILYLHRISDIRMTGSLLKNLKIFVNLCGIQSMPNVVIVTTMWSNVDAQQGETREQELKNKMWFNMIEKGCNVKKFDGTYRSALEILAP
ncbi:Translocase of chloroplast, partial [Serendipita sp. 400]